MKHFIALALLTSACSVNTDPVLAEGDASEANFVDAGPQRGEDTGALGNDQGARDAVVIARDAEADATPDHRDAAPTDQGGADAARPDAARPDAARPDMEAEVDEGVGADMAPDAAPLDAGPPVACRNRAYQAACDQAPDERACAAAGGEWGQFFRGDPGRCRCATIDGGCPCAADGDCSQFCYVPVNEGVCSGLPARCYEYNVLSSCFCDPTGQGQACP